jgi:hypothetical protein
LDQRRAVEEGTHLGLMEKGRMYNAFCKMQFREKASKNLISENKEIACYILQDVTKTTVGDISRTPSSQDRFLPTIDRSNWLKRTDREKLYCLCSLFRISP